MISDQVKININSLPKKFCDGAIGDFCEEYFAFSITSGNNLDSYAATPKIMKSVLIFFNKQLERYEKEFGEIDMTPPKIESPIQKADLKKFRGK